MKTRCLLASFVLGGLMILGLLGLLGGAERPAAAAPLETGVLPASGSRPAAQAASPTAGARPAREGEAEVERPFPSAIPDLLTGEGRRAALPGRISGSSADDPRSFISREQVGSIAAPAGLDGEATRSLARALPARAQFPLGLPPAPDRPAPASRAPAVELHVCRQGLPDCQYTSIQAAVDDAAEGDLIKVAAGVYSDTHGRQRNDLTDTGTVTQVVYLTKGLTLRGGYAADDWETYDPAGNRAVLDAAGRGRVIYVAHPDAPVSLEGLYLTGGAAGGLEGDVDGDAGGGVYAIWAELTLTDCAIYSNTAGAQGDSLGGGLYSYDSLALISNSTFTNNTASALGGGVFLGSVDATLDGNLLSHNEAEYGGGLLLADAVATLTDSKLFDNAAGDGGGGVYLFNDVAWLGGNTISQNAARAGGGVYVYAGYNWLIGNTLADNQGTASCGGLQLQESVAILEGNRVVNNRAPYAGGVFVGLSSATMDNNLIADNRADGVYAQGSVLDMRHNTIARNTGRGVYVGSYVGGGEFPSSVVMTNTILAGHTLYGIYVNVAVFGDENRAALEGTLWGSGAWANAADWYVAAGAIFDNGTVNLWQEPGFVDPDNGDYHLAPASAAVDAGVMLDVRSDLEGDPRPAGSGYDLGADETPGACLWLQKQTRQPAYSPGETITYTIPITSVGIASATHVYLTDTLPVYQRPVAVAAGQDICAADTTWGGLVTCTLGDIPTRTSRIVTITAQMTTTRPPSLPIRMINTVQVGGDNTANQASLELLMHDCHLRINGNLPEISYVQLAVDVANAGDTVWAAGYCVGTEERSGLRQVAYLDKSVSFKGGYSTDFVSWDPDLYPTIWDAQGEGRVVFITGNVSPTLEGLHLTNGDASGQGPTHLAEVTGEGEGGGIYLEGSTAVISRCAIYDNVASRANWGAGGGLFLSESDARLSDTTVSSNTASTAADGEGGGIAIWGGAPVLQGNRVRNNQASVGGVGLGGGVCLHGSPAALSDNTVANNVASAYWAGYGGGLFLDESDAILDGNTVADNAGSEAFLSFGGGLYLWDSSAALRGNVVRHNVVDGAKAPNMVAGLGGGLLIDASPVSLVGNTVVGNQAGVDFDGDGGGLFVVGDSDAVLEGNQILSNTAEGLGGGVYLESNYDLPLRRNRVAGNAADDFGGGVYCWDCDGLDMQGNTVQSNTARLDGGGLYVGDSDGLRLDANQFLGNQAHHYDGGGLYIDKADAVTLTANTFGWNKAGQTFSGYGGGAYFRRTTVLLQGNVASHNLACDCDSGIGYGGGFAFQDSNVVLEGNTLQENAAGRGIDSSVGGYGGGVWIESCTAVVSGNQILGNTAGTTAAGGGGGLSAGSSTLTLEGNLVRGNLGSPVSSGTGGGLSLSASAVTMRHNRVEGNASSATRNGYGGGAYLSNCSGTVDANTFISNTAALSATAKGYGGGLYLGWNQNLLIFSNNVVAENRANAKGAGMYLPGNVLGDFLHNTIADNQGGAGIYLEGLTFRHSALAFTNTIIAGHAVGISVTTYATATLEGTLWYDNAIPSGGGGTIQTGAVNVWDDPAFAGAGDYHITDLSAARDSGVPSGIATDMDGDTRPAGLGYDIGADEFLAGAPVAVVKEVTPSLAAGGEPVTYTIRVTNLGEEAFAAEVTDYLPVHVTPGGTLAWQTGGLAPGQVWVQTVVVTVEAGYTGPLTNVVRVATDSGATAAYTATSSANSCVQLASVALEGPAAVAVGRDASFVASTAPLNAGQPITYNWEASGQPAVEHPAAGLSDTAVFTWPVTGRQAVTVTAANRCGPPVSQSWVVTVTNLPPVADAGPDQTVLAGTFVMLNAGGSYDPDGHLPLAYGWQQRGEPAVTLDDPASPTPYFAAPATQTVLTFTLAVTDSYGLPDPTPDQVVINVVTQCVALTGVGIGGPAEGVAGTVYTFTGVYTPAAATTPVLLTWLPPPLGAQSSASASYRWDVAGTYTVTLRAENCGGTVQVDHPITIAAEAAQPKLFLPVVVRGSSGRRPAATRGAGR